MTKLTNEVKDLSNLSLVQLYGSYSVVTYAYDSEEGKYRRDLEAEILQRMAEGAAGEASPQNVEWIDWLLGYFDDKAINEGQQKIIVRELKKLKRGSASIAGPRCPKCQKEMLVLHSSNVFKAYVECHNDEECDFDLATNEIADFAQFFAAAPAESTKEK